MYLDQAAPATTGASHTNTSTGDKRKFDDVNAGSGYQDNDDPVKKMKTECPSSCAELSTNSECSPVNKSPKEKNEQKGDGICKGKTKEKRHRRFRKHAPTSYLEIKDRALSQRLTVVKRERCEIGELPEEKLTVAGSTGNLYTVNIGLVPKCDCPHAKKGNQCKHIIYVMLRVLKAPESTGYQLALTPSELRSIFKNASPIPSADAKADSSDGSRKPIEGECPICYADFEADEAIVYCKAACGNNIHEKCMVNWKAASDAKATCPLCRTNWVDQEVPCGKEVNMENAVWNEGYRNVGSQLNLPAKRDSSTYHRPSVRAQFGKRYRF